MKLKNLFSNLKNKLSLISGKNKKFIVLGVVLTVLVLGVFAFPKNKSTDDSEKETYELSESGSRDYENELELKIKQMLLSMSEIQTANVMVFCDSSGRCDYLKNKTETISGTGESSSKTITEEVVYEKNGSNTSAIIVSKTMPKINGVWVVINQVSASTKLAIINSISSVLNIDSSSISILQE